MSLLFSEGKIGTLSLPNRFVASATYEGQSRENGMVGDELVHRYVNLARGGVGLIITGYMFVHPLGRSMRFQTGLHSDDMIPGLTRLTESVHREGGRIIFQIAHGGRQTRPELVGGTPLGPSAKVRDPLYFFKPRAMTEDQIAEVIWAFGQAARRAAEAGADGVQLHAAHGYLLSQFLSPFLNRRQDQWGGSPENRFRLLREVYLVTRRHLPADKPILVKINTHDYTPQPGVTPDLAAWYGQRLVELGVDAVELSCGAGNFSFMNLCRGEVPVPEMLESMAWWQRPLARVVLGRMKDKFDLVEAYNLDAARMIRPALGLTPLVLVGGMRTLAGMEGVLASGVADYVALSRPFIRDPFLVRKFREGRADQVSCISCNRCLAALLKETPIRCYVNGFRGQAPPDAAGSTR
jgi:2,4-dienoyl-CoA reductase-like NADH-dependent reductase (Old Yellow Enzyme family)